MMSPTQLGSGVKLGAEAAVHATTRCFEERGCAQGLLKLDFSDAINSTNRDILLQTVAITRAIQICTVHTQKSPTCSLASTSSCLQKVSSEMIHSVRYLLCHWSERRSRNWMFGTFLLFLALGAGRVCHRHWNRRHCQYDSSVASPSSFSLWLRISTTVTACGSGRSVDRRWQLIEVIDEHDQSTLGHISQRDMMEP